jgi:hypothetical protein
VRLTVDLIEANGEQAGSIADPLFGPETVECL